MSGVEDSGNYNGSYNNNGPPRRSSRSRSPGDRGRGGSSQADNNPGNNLHVSGLSPKVDDRELEALFVKVGRVTKAQVVYDPHSREPRGFGFVTMQTPEEADAAVTALNNTEQFGKSIIVAKV
ncbi:RNA-binding domain-containing protein [Gymnopus androsaceus JB14]|uniref:RNA-binding domain-containing protein n=1 Tax=Gymnopus androsaceus JB14 TaxID=1447944 RepID=A0A6A4IE89_9AGAR|nr:RNA-binding domain-containing protein [Gymnopus androsaceus JB14]